MKRIILFLIITAFVAAVNGYCLTADDYAAQGDAYLQNNDPVNAFNAYKQAYDFDNNHSWANTALGILSLPYYLFEEGNSAATDFLNTYGIIVNGNIFDLNIRNSGGSRPLPPDIQNFVKLHVLTAMDTSLWHFDRVDAAMARTIAYTEPELQVIESNSGWGYSQLLLLDSGSCFGGSFSGWNSALWNYFSDASPFFPANPAVGYSWTTTTFWGCTVTATVTGMTETVNTPAGTFTDCVKIVYDYTYKPDIYQEYFRITRYFKECVGLVRIVIEWADSQTATGTLLAYAVSGTGYLPCDTGNQWTYGWDQYRWMGSLTETIAVAWVKTSEKEFDNGEIQAAKAFLHLLKGMLNVACAYNGDDISDYNEWDAQDFHNITEALTVYPNLLAIKDQDRMTAALTDFRSFFDCLITAFDSINSETDPQENDLLRFPAGKETIFGSLSFNDIKSDLRGLLVTLRSALDTGGTNLDLTDLALKATYYESGAPVRFPQRLDLSKFFTDPVTRTDLQDIQYDAFNNLQYSSLWNVDHTLHGVFPDMTNAELVGYCRGNTPRIEELVLTGENSVGITGSVSHWSGASGAISDIQIYRNPTAHIGSTLIATLSPEQWFQAVDANATADLYYYYAKVNYTDGSYLVSSPRRLAKKLYVKTNANGLPKGTVSEPYERISSALNTANQGTTVCIAGGTYVLAEENLPSLPWWPGMYSWLEIPKDNIHVLGSCSPVTWQSNLFLYPTAIDGSGCLGCFNTTDNVNGYWREAWGVVIENLLVKNAFAGICLSGSRHVVRACVVTGCREESGWGYGITLDGNSNMVENCTVDGNDFGVYIYGWGDGDEVNHVVRNNIITNNSTYGLYFESEGDVSFNDIWGNWDGNLPEGEYGPGNLSLDPLFVDRASDNYRLQDGSPCIGAGENGVNMGAYQGDDVLPGDMNGDGEADISDVILALRVCIGLPVTLEGTVYNEPYPDWLIWRADLNGDGDPDITDVILNLHKVIGLE